MGRHGGIRFRGLLRRPLGIQSWSVEPMILWLLLPNVLTVTDIWTQILPLESCYRNPGEAWADRFNVKCTVHWPGERADAALVVFRGKLYLHGGYRTFFPYPQSNGRGAASGTGRQGSSGYTPYPTFPYYMDDLWSYDYGTEHCCYCGNCADAVV